VQAAPVTPSSAVNVRWSPGPSGLLSLADQLTTAPSTENATPVGSGGVALAPVLRTSAENTTGWPAPVGCGVQETSTTTRFAAASSTDASAVGDGVVGSAVVGPGAADDVPAELDAAVLGGAGGVDVGTAVGLGIAEVVVGAGTRVPAPGGGALVAVGPPDSGAGAFSVTGGWAGPEARPTPTGSSCPELVTTSGMITGIVASRTTTRPSNTCVRDGRCRLTESSGRGQRSMHLTDRGHSATRVAGGQLPGRNCITAAEAAAPPAGWPSRPARRSSPRRGSPRPPGCP